CGAMGSVLIPRHRPRDRLWRDDRGSTAGVRLPSGAAVGCPANHARHVAVLARGIRDRRSHRADRLLPIAALGPSARANRRGGRLRDPRACRRRANLQKLAAAALIGLVGALGLFSPYDKFQEVLLREEGVFFGEGVAGVGHLFEGSVARAEVLLCEAGVAGALVVLEIHER